MLIYTVEKGDSLYGIAQKHEISPEKIAQASQLTDTERLVVGQSLVIPLEQERGSAQEKPIIVNGYCYPHITTDVLETTLPYLTYISPFSYNVREDGSLTALNDEAVIAKARLRRVAPLMVITNLDRTDRFSSDLASLILQNPSLQETLLDNILNTMFSKGLHGLDVDFEYVLRQDRDYYSAFLERAAQKLHPHGFRLSTAVAAKTSDTDTGPLFDGVDHVAQGQIVDMMLLMTYDWGYKYGPPMAVSPYPMMEKAVQYAAARVPSQKILLGMPNYGYDWILPYEPTVGADLIMNQAAVNLAVNTWSEIKFDENSQTPYFNYTDRQGRRRVVWFDDAQSFRAKLGLVRKYDLAGIGYWNINTLFLPGWLILASMYDIYRTD